MPPESTSLTPAVLRAVRRNLAEVTDRQLLQVVAVVDQMAERGRADELIGPLRARFGRVRPPRPLRFTRLLFLPLDPVMIPATHYRLRMPAMPRSVAAPMSALVHEALGESATQIEAAIAGRSATDLDVIAAVGGCLWPEAAAILATAILANAAPPPGWAVSGLPGHLFAPLARSIAAVLRQAEALQAIILDTDAGLPLELSVVDEFLTAAAPDGPDAWALVLAVLLACLPATGAVLQRATFWAERHGDTALRAAIEPVVEAQLVLLEMRGPADEMLTSDLASVSAEVRRVASLLEGFETGSPAATRRVRVDAIRRRLDASCRTRFANGLAEELLAPLQAMAATGAVAAPPTLEAAARHLRALETEARRLGSAATYDVLLRQTAEAVRRIKREAGLLRVDKIRLVEILAGPEAAIPLLA